LQHDQLMSERGILCFKSALGLEERGSQVKDEEYAFGMIRPENGGFPHAIPPANL
jgi:hypothetical protein